MNELDNMLEAPREAVLPPIVRYCNERKVAGDIVKIELLRPDNGSSVARTELVIHRWEDGKEQEPRQFEWDDGVNAAFVDIGIRAVNVRQEAERSALSIRAALRKVARRYGDGYLNAVLVDLLDESDLCKSGEIADVRKYVHTNAPERGRSYSECRELIANEIAGRAVELRDKLNYKAEDIKGIMTSALAIYLDERFSVSSRRSFGLL
jgi:hypothetical protein